MTARTQRILTAALATALLIISFLPWFRTTYGYSAALGGRKLHTTANAWNSLTLWGTALVLALNGAASTAPANWATARDWGSGRCCC